MLDHVSRRLPDDIPALVISLAAAAIAAGVGGLASVNAAAKYGLLVQPSWAPPAWLFGPVWTVLYVLMGVAAWLVWRTRPPVATRALSAYGIQLVLNALWTPLFFGLGWRGAALAEIAVLWIALAVTITLFWRSSRIAAYLLVPYLVWTTFAVCLNFSVWQLNTAVA
ncbi:tryptophan-rich sensory protein [Mycobacteroides immunogenum]|uniref:TspO/MBR family protein n=1 Tax=Mycobacteroides immunogenum TaxID=83262 RepID=UPI0025B76DCE|nr:TspO/MBR family protein [Mycobacteroides immunogenum]WJR35800.1 tryptophan-rich sensory protein [Mycobacteroides immunogenum]